MRGCHAADSATSSSGFSFIPRPATSLAFIRKLVLPVAAEQLSLMTLRNKLNKIGAKIVRHQRYVIFEVAEFAGYRDLFADTLCRVDRPRPKAAPT